LKKKNLKPGFDLGKMYRR